MRIAGLLLVLSGVLDTWAGRSGPDAGPPPDSLGATPRGESLTFVLPGLEAISDMMMTEEETLEFLEMLVWRHEHPRNLNVMTLEELQTLPFVTPSEAENILRRREESGLFKSTDQLKEMSDELHTKIQPFVFVADTAVSPPEPPLIQTRFRLSRSYPFQEARAESAFLGSPYRMYGRVHFTTSPHSEVGALFEKDPGEMERYGFASGYLLIHSLGIISSAIAGDFTVQEGEGLILGRQGAMNEVRARMAFVSNDLSGMRPYEQANEVGFFRGAALSTLVCTGAGRLRLSLYYSQRAVNAALDEEGRIMSFDADGLFRTRTELGKRGTAGERFIGGHIEWASSVGISAGVTYSGSTFQQPVAGKGIFSFSGSRAEVFGADAKIRLQGFAASGEVARSSGGGVAMTAASRVSFGPGTTVSIGVRRSSPEFISFHSGRSTGNRKENIEQGFSAGVDVAINRWLHLQGWLDQFRTLWRTYDDPLPVEGDKVHVGLNATLLRDLTMTFSFGQGTGETTETLVDSYRRTTKRIVERSERILRIGALFHLKGKLSVKAGAALIEVRYPSFDVMECGSLLSNELHWELVRGLFLNGSVAFYQTGSYDSRLFIYEADAGGAVSGSSLYGRGMRWSLVVCCRSGRSMSISGKIVRDFREPLPLQQTPSPGQAAVAFVIQLDLAY